MQTVHGRERVGGSAPLPPPPPPFLPHGDEEEGSVPHARAGVGGAHLCRSERSTKYRGRRTVLA
eukprot:scaffold235191_cov36-Tisochrysis_lutea.AAC.1